MRSWLKKGPHLSTATLSGEISWLPLETGYSVLFFNQLSRLPAQAARKFLEEIFSRNKPLTGFVRLDKQSS